MITENGRGVSKAQNFSNMAFIALRLRSFNLKLVCKCLYLSGVCTMFASFPLFGGK